MRLTDEAETKRASRLRRRQREATKPTEEPEMDVNDGRLEVEEEMLAHGVGANETRAGEALGVAKASLRRAHFEALSSEVTREVARESMNRVSFGHVKDLGAHTVDDQRR